MYSWYVVSAGSKSINLVAKIVHILVCEVVFYFSAQKVYNFPRRS